MKTLGVSKLGHRKKLLRRIAVLRGETAMTDSSSHAGSINSSSAAESSENHDDPRTYPFLITDHLVHHRKTEARAPASNEAAYTGVASIGCFWTHQGFDRSLWRLWPNLVVLPRLPCFRHTIPFAPALILLLHIYPLSSMHLLTLLPLNSLFDA